MKKKTFLENEYYHLFNRGIDKRMVFSTQGDFDRFKAYLYLLNDEESPRAANFFEGNRQASIYTSGRANPLIAIGAYCLMPTHFHIIATPLVENGISRFMQKLLTAYTMYFNQRILRSGSLFQGTYKSQRIQNDSHLKYLYSYIHFNPAGYFHDDWQVASEADLLALERNISTYPYSSAREYFTSTFVIVSPSYYPRYLTRAKDMRAHLNFWIKFRDTMRETSDRVIGIN